MAKLHFRGIFNSRRGAQNFNPECAMAGKITIAEVEQVVEIGELL